MSSSQLSETELEKVKVKLQEEGVARCPSEGCSETFKSIWGLRFHLKKNTCNAPKFKCEKCDEGFSTRIILQQHCETCFGEYKKTSKVADSVTTVESEESGLKRAFLQEKEDVPVNNNKKAKISQSTEKDSGIVSIPETPETQSKTTEITSASSSTSTSETTITEEKLSEISTKTPEHSSSKLDSRDNAPASVFIPNLIKKLTERVKSSQSSNTTIETEISTSESQEQLGPTKDSSNIDINNTDSSQIVEPQKKKRGRPKKSQSQSPKTSKQQTITSDTNLNGEEFVTPKKKRGRGKKTPETPRNKIVTPPSRRSSRSTAKKGTCISRNKLQSNLHLQKIS